MVTGVTPPWHKDYTVAGYTMAAVRKRQPPKRVL